MLSRVTFGHKSFALNEHYTAANPPVLDTSKVNDEVTIDRLLVRPAYRDTRDALHLAQGGTAGRVHKGFLVLSAMGRILVPNASQPASMSDRERALRLAFDPYECYRDSPTTDGVYALDWYEPTTDTTTYTSGWIAVRRYGRPMAQPETVWSKEDGTSRQWACALACPDPRLYEQTMATTTVTTPFASTNLVNNGSIPAPLQVTITMSGAGASNFTLTRSAVSFVLDLSGCIAADVVVVTMETCGPFGRGKRITKNGSEAFSLKTSGATTWLDVPAGTTAFTMSNTTGVTSVKLDHYHARP
jgi:hypothetical protein